LSILTGYASNKLSTRSEEIKTRYTLAEVQELADKWMVDYENNHVHSGIGQTPMQRWNSSLEAGWRPDMVDRECLFILLKPAEPRKISKGRINFNGGIFTSPDLDYLDQAATVFVRPDPENAGLLYVFDHDQIFLTIAQDLQRLNLTPKEITTRKKQWWKIRRDERRATLARAALLDMDALERERLDAAVAEAKRREGPTVEPNIIRIPEIEKAAEARAVALGEKEPPVPEREARPAPADPNARPEFDDPDLRYEWIAQQLGRGGEIDKRDQAFAEHYERTSKYFEWMGGADYKARLMGRKIAAAN